METLNKYIPAFIRRINRNYLIAFVVIVMVLSAILRVFTPPVAEKALLIQEDSLKQQGTKISFASIKLETPEEMSIFQAQNASQSIQDYTQKLANTLNYTAVNRIENVWVNDAGTSSVSVEEVNNTVLFKNFFSPDELENIVATTTKDQAKSIFTQFLDTKVGLKGYEITQEDAVIVDSEEIIPAGEVTANAFQITASQIVEGVPFTVGTRRSSLASGIVLRNGKILEVNFFPETKTLTKIFSQKTISLDQVQKNTQNGLLTYILVSATSIDHNNASSDTLKEVLFDSAKLEYRENEENGYIVPYVHFKGLGRNQANQEYAVEAISPAVKVQ